MCLARSSRKSRYPVTGLVLYVNGDVMISTEERPKSIASALVDLRDLPLAKIPDLNTAVLDEATRRILRETPSVPVAAFNSAI